MKISALSIGTLALLFAPFAITHAVYAPPCQRGDMYEGGTSYREAFCVERKAVKAARALRFQGGTAKRIFTGETRRTQKEEVRKVYLHPTSVREAGKTTVKERNVQTRRHSVRIRTMPVELRPTTEERLAAPHVFRQDLRPIARQSLRSRQTMQKTIRRENLEEKRGTRTQGLMP